MSMSVNRTPILAMSLLRATTLMAVFTVSAKKASMVMDLSVEVNKYFNYSDNH